MKRPVILVPGISCQTGHTYVQRMEVERVGQAYGCASSMRFGVFPDAVATSCSWTMDSQAAWQPSELTALA